jgi:hypothetical protein
MLGLEITECCAELKEKETEEEKDGGRKGEYYACTEAPERWNIQQIVDVRESPQIH